MNSDRNQKIANSFGSRADLYDAHAGLQARVAAELSQYLPVISDGQILEIGCGTGLFTEHLLGRYNRSQLYITDLSTDMLATCRNRIGPHSNIRFLQCDGENLPGNRELCSLQFDMIATSMTIQWFQDPARSLRALTGFLKPGGMLLYSTIGPDCFPEWHEVLEQLDLPAGTLEIPDLPGVFASKRIEIRNTGSQTFFSGLKALGAATPRQDYIPLNAGIMRKALRLLDERFDRTVSWQIVFGKLRSPLQTQIFS